jgi:hypothetical protein
MKSAAMVDAVRRLGCEHRDVQLGQPAIRRHVELAHRLLVPPVFRLRECVAEVDRVRQVEAGRAVVHQVDVGADVVPNALAEIGVGPRVAPAVELDRGVPEFEALVGDLEELLGGAEVEVLA